MTREFRSLKIIKLELLPPCTDVMRNCVLRMGSHPTTQTLTFDKQTPKSNQSIQFEYKWTFFFFFYKFEKQECEVTHVNDEFAAHCSQRRMIEND